MRYIALIFMFTAAPLQADVTGPGGRVIDCYCTDTSGARQELGEEICLYVDGRAFMARCEMSLNVPMWRDTGDLCLSSRLQPRKGQPVQNTPLIYPEI
nr:hypothetical protein [Paenihalocynthiibacter styelae]